MIEWVPSRLDLCEGWNEWRPVEFIGGRCSGPRIDRGCCCRWSWQWP